MSHHNWLLSMVILIVNKYEFYNLIVFVQCSISNYFLFEDAKEILVQNELILLF